jgi:lipopolysaccharide/colanic/teichoic acid biosynthesis glycosyltransferase
VGQVWQTRELVLVSERPERVPRVTPVGRFPRIDGVPHLINVLKGDMSPAGLRPHVFAMLAGGPLYEKPVPRSAIPAGFADDRARARIDYYFAYILNFSFCLDLKILFTTLRREFVGGSAD